MPPIKKSLWTTVKEWLLVSLGILIYVSGWTIFLIPNNLVGGGVSGISSIIQYATAGKIQMGYTYFAINAILLILAWVLIGHEFGAKTVYTAMILGPLTDVWDAILPWQSIANENLVTGTPSVMGDPWLDLCCFVLLLSASQALMFSINASTGGLDILAKIVNKYLHFDIGTSVSIAGAIICCTAFFINPFRMVVIGLIGTWINGLVVDYFTASLNNRKRVCIVSKDYDRIRRYIIDDLHRGCTLYEVIGGYTNERSIELEVLLTKDEFSNLMAFLRDNEIAAFTTAGNVSEVYGLWTKHNKKKQIKEHADNR